MKWLGLIALGMTCGVIGDYEDHAGWVGPDGSLWGLVGVVIILIGLFGIWREQP